MFDDKVLLRVRLLKQFAQYNPELGSAQLQSAPLADATGLSGATCYELLKEMEQEKLLARGHGFWEATTRGISYYHSYKSKFSPEELRAKSPS